MYTFRTGTAIEHGEHTWETWNAEVQPGDLPDWVTRDDTGICCHTCEVIVIDKVVPGTMHMTIVEEPAPECLNAGPDCNGAVEYRMPLSGTGRSFPRCDKHWDDRLDTEQGINERYPTHAPADFDPTYAGEHWNEDY